MTTEPTKNNSNMQVTSMISAGGVLVPGIQKLRKRSMSSISTTGPTVMNQYLSNLCRIIISLCEKSQYHYCSSVRLVCFEQDRVWFKVKSQKSPQLTRETSKRMIISLRINISNIEL